MAVIGDPRIEWQKPQPAYDSIRSSNPFLQIDSDGYACLRPEVMDKLIRIEVLLELIHVAVQRHDFYGNLVTPNK